MHTTSSDGSLSPSQVVDLAVKKGMKAIAITDHDTLSGLKEAVEYATGKNLEVVEGVELSCHELFYPKTIDVLGLFVSYKSKDLNNFLEKCRQDRVTEKQEMV